ncbi:S-layer homology domain-containing protein [Paenibacillus yanchengensis]|uniref:S-layer homology domain-containing protein n=1 Tax=Paenibacillus yanchengensis TaxID=2035833 RepID=A0ABW4YIX7_9BACL
MNSLTKKPIVKKAMLFTIMLSLITSMFVGLPNSEVAAYTKTKTVKLEPSTMDRTWDGWGTALVWFGHATGGWKTEQRDKLVDALYSEEGLNYNIARYNIGGGDDPTHTHMRKGGDVPGFATGFGEDGKIAFDFTADANQRWWLQEAKKRWEQRDETFITEAFSNSPPYFMTISGCTAGHWDGGTSNLDPKHYPDFAEYLATVVEHYKEEHGITFDTLSVVNEPNTDYWSANNRQEGSHWDPWQQSWVIYEAYQALVAKGLAGEGVADEDEVKIAAMDESIIDTFLTNWAEYGQDTKDIVSQFNVHAYGGSKRQEVRDLAKRENKKLWMSEVDLGPGGVPHNHEDMEPGLSLAWQIMTDVRWFEPEAWVLWQAVEEEHNMREDKENMNWGLIHADFDTEEWWYTKKYYAMGQFSKFIPQGSKFFQNNDWDEQYTLTAYNEKDNETVIVYRNPDDEATQVTFDLSEFATPGKAVKTYVTSEDKNLAEGQTAVIGNQLFAEVEGKSITTFVIEGAAYKEGETSTSAGMLEALQADLAGYEGAGREDVAFFTAQITAALESNDEVQQYATLENVSKAFFELKAGKIPQSTMNVLASSEEIAGSNEGAANAIDGKTSSIWHTAWGKDSLPATMEFDFDWNRDGIYKLEYVPRQDNSSNGVATAYEVHVADDTGEYKLVAKGEWAANKDVKIVTFNAVNATKLKLVITGSQDGSYASAAEINVYRSPSFVVNTSELQAAIEEANKIIEQAESETDYANLREVVSIAEALRQSSTATQEAIDQMVADIRLVLSKVNEIKVEIAYAPQAHYSTPIEHMVDGNVWTMYESNWESSDKSFEAGDYIVLDLGKAYEDVGQIMYSPRLNGEAHEVENGRMKQYRIFTSDQDLNSIEWNGSSEQLAEHFKIAGFGGMDVTKGSTQTITFAPKKARYVAIQVLKTGGDGSTLSIGELAVSKSTENEFNTARVDQAIENLDKIYNERTAYVQHKINEYVDEAKLENDRSLLTKEAIEHYGYKLESLYEKYKEKKYNVTEFKNGETWYDTEGEPIQAHGANIIYDENKKRYYWYGEDKTESNLGAGYVPMTGVHAYSSTDLYNWENEGIVLPVFNNPNLGDESYDGEKVNEADIPMYIHEDDELYKTSGVPFNAERQKEKKKYVDNWERERPNNSEAYFENLTGNMRSPVETLKKHNTKDRIKALNELYKNHSLEEKQNLYRLFNWDKVVERPKVVYNEDTGKYIMWWHHDGPIAGEYWTAAGGVAISDSPTGPFEVLDIKRLPNDDWETRNDGMLRDMTVYVDTDKTAYLIYSSEGNATTIIMKLDKTYTKPATDENKKSIQGTHWVKAHTAWREAPTMFKQDGTYYSITSGLTGWNPNPAEYHIAPNIFGPWELKGNPFKDDKKGTTHDSQSTFVLPVRDNAGKIIPNKFIFMADRWNPDKLTDSRYIWFPLHLDSANKEIAMEWKQNWNLKKEFGITDVEKDIFTVTFDSNGGSDVAPIKDVKKGSTIAAPAKPEKAGHTFLGWYTAATGGDKWDFAVNKVNSTLTLFAQWKKDDEVTPGGGAVYPPFVPEEKPDGNGGTDGEEGSTKPEPKANFTDTTQHWAEASIARLVELGAVTGYPDQTFKPERAITRAEFTALLVRLVAPDLTEKISHTYKDLAGHYAENAIAQATSLGIVTGYPNNSFKPNDQMTREQMAVMLMRAFELTDGEKKDVTFVDKETISAWAVDAVTKASNLEIITGYPNGKFAPAEIATRAQAVVMLDRVLQLLGK